MCQTHAPVFVDTQQTCAPVFFCVFDFRLDLRRYSRIYPENRHMRVMNLICAIAHIFCARDTFLYIAHIYVIMITENLSS